MSDEPMTLRERALAYLRDEANGFHLYNHPSERALARIIGCSKTQAHRALVIWRAEDFYPWGEVFDRRAPEALLDGPCKLRQWGQGVRAADRKTADEIRLKYFQGKYLTELAREYDLCPSTIKSIVERKGPYALDIGLVGE